MPLALRCAAWLRIHTSTFNALKYEVLDAAAVCTFQLVSIPCILLHWPQHVKHQLHRLMLRGHSCRMTALLQQEARATWDSLPDSMADLVLHKAFDVWYDGRGQLRLVCKRWAQQILLEVEHAGIYIRRPLEPELSRFLLQQLPRLT